MPVHLSQCHSSSTVSMCLFAELVLATAQVNADSNAKKVEGKQNGQDSMRHE